MKKINFIFMVSLIIFLEMQSMAMDDQSISTELTQSTELSQSIEDFERCCKIFYNWGINAERRVRREVDRDEQINVLRKRVCSQVIYSKINPGIEYKVCSEVALSVDFTKNRSQNYYQGFNAGLAAGNKLIHEHACIIKNSELEAFKKQIRNQGYHDGFHASNEQNSKFINQAMYKGILSGVITTAVAGFALVFMIKINSYAGNK